MAELILGIHGGANSTAAIAVDGELAWCVQEERLTGIKGYMGFPHRAIAACLAAVGADPADLGAVAYGSVSGPVEHCPRDEWLRRLRGFHRRPMLAKAEAQLVSAVPAGMDRRVRELLHEAGIRNANVTFHDHHTTHGAAAYYGLRATPDQPYLVVTCDGFGDGACATATIWHHGHRVEIARTDMRNSLGLLWFWLTYASGFTPHEDEFKLMGMAPYADPGRAAHAAGILRRHLRLDETGLRFQRANPKSSIERSWPRIHAELQGLRFDDLFAGLQMFTDELLTTWIANAIAATGIHDVLAGGGVFMNIKSNQRIAALDTVHSFAAFPSCSDESLALGALYLQLADQHGHQHVAPLASCYLGDDITDDAALAAVTGTGLHITRPSDVHQAVAQLLARGVIVARCAGRMEYGARALGNRSILADPADADIPRRLNRTIKHRDFWMPFAPAILASAADQYLYNPKTLTSPYMMLGFETIPGAERDMIAALHPADLTSRPQIIDDNDTSGLAAILTRYQHLTGRPVLLNTSLNLHGHPIARTATDAVHVLQHSDLTHLQLGNLLVSKSMPA
ncbi:carbamoyltransferase C-terminal domain-containing protein [Dactylosporangium sp. CA-233914]|uniref:carbamoyltransferase C-terminal domain-containing protein n=1 Tax=Dactylosporangium sp. CA-233914 TaxID=3239934 RepID=UPI003D92A707